MKKIAAIGVLGIMTSCLFGQGLTTSATKDDWEEINFEFNSSILSDGYPSLLRLAELLNQNKDYRVKVTGHTDYVGSAGYNEKLALSRANTVKDFLVKYGASADQVTTAGDGKRNPSVSNNTKEGRFVNRRVVLTLTDGTGKIVSAAGVGEAIKTMSEIARKQEECCSQILKRLDKLDDILAAVRDLKGENDRIKSELATLRSQQNALKDQLKDQIAKLPKPLTTQETTDIARKESTAASNEAMEEAQRRNRKFSLLGLNVGPTMGAGRTGDFTFSGRGQYFSPFGGSGSRAVQAQGEYMYYPGRQEGQFDIGLVNRWNNVQAGLFSSFKFVSFREYKNGGALAQGAFTLDYLFNRGKVGLFATKGFKNYAVLNRVNIGPQSFLETYARVVDQIGASATVGAWKNAYFETNLGYLKRHGAGSDRPGGMLRLVHPLNDVFALTVEAGLNETYLNAKDSGRFVVGFQFGNFIRPKEFATVKTPVPVDIPRVRYELLTRRIGNSPPVADAGPDQAGVPAGPVTLDGSGSYDPDGDALTYLWSQIAGPAVSITNATSAKASFTAGLGQTYSFRLTVRDSGGAQSVARTTVATNNPAPVRILTFAAEPNSILPGERTRLRWVVEGADSVSIAPQPGNVDAKQGQVDVTPAQTTTYTLTARGAGGTVTATQIVTIQAPQPSDPRIVRFEATPTNITRGESSTLAWSTEGATEVSISGIGRVDNSGSRTVSPTTTTTYTLTARGADGRQVTAPVVVTVSDGNAPRVISFGANPVNINTGGTSQLCWNVENATAVDIPGIGTALKGTDCANVQPTATTTYTLTARNNAGQITASATVNVGQVRILSFASDPVYTIKAGDPVTLKWTTEGATSVVLTGNFVTGTKFDLNGSVTVNPTTNSTYTLTAYGPNGTSVSAVLYVFVR
jgi:hypothetical protein